jgi:hypothetical protein
MKNEISYKGPYAFLNSQYPITFVPEGDLDNKIIILDKNAVMWAKKKFDNKITNSEEQLEFQIKHVSPKIDIIIRSLNKIQDINNNLIKVLELKKIN